MHMHYYVFAGALADIAAALAARPPLEGAHPEPVSAACRRLDSTLEWTPG